MLLNINIYIFIFLFQHKFTSVGESSGNSLANKGMVSGIAQDTFQYH